MGRFILRRIGQSVLTIIGVMIITFLLFRVVAGDIAAAHIGAKAPQRQRADWRHLHGYDRPLWLNFHKHLLIIDQTKGEGLLDVKDVGNSIAADAMALILTEDSPSKRMGRYVFRLSDTTPIQRLTGGAPLEPMVEKDGEKVRAKAQMQISLASGTSLTVDISGIRTCGELLNRINNDPKNRNPETDRPLVDAKVSKWSILDLLDTQFFDHFYKSATFQSRSLVTNKKLTEIIAERAPRSLALMIPATAIGWVLAMIISCFVGYYRGTILDRVGVFLSVLGMCIPFLAFMIYGQWLMFNTAPRHAFGLEYPVNIYAPILIMVIAGLGASVRFYRTVILDETNRDYVRTARAKGAPLGSILFKHILKNCMLPILTNLIMAIPFLIMGSLLMETYFGIPGLGDLMLSSINGRDEPILSGLVFLSAVFYTVAVLVTDLSYAVFDPRIRLR